MDGYLRDGAKGLVELGPHITLPLDPQQRDPELDMLRVENGYNSDPMEPSSYAYELPRPILSGTGRSVPSSNGRFNPNFDAMAA